MRRDLAMLGMAALTACTQPADRPDRLAVGSVACDYCRMTVTGEQHAAQITRPRGATRAFDEPGCLLRYAASAGLAEDEHPWVHTADSGWRDARSAWYALPDRTPPGMMYGITAHADSTSAVAALHGPGRVARYQAALAASGR